MEYETLTTQDKVSIAKDALRGKESDHFRLSLSDPSFAGGQEHIDKLAEDIVKIQESITVLEAELPEEPPAPPYPPPYEPTTEVAAPAEDAAQE